MRPLPPPYRRRPITPRQAEVLRFVRTFFAANGYPPTQREAATALGLSVSTVNRHLSALASLGYLEVLYRGGRNYWPVEQPRGTS